MAIAKKPLSQPTITPDDTAEKFIMGASQAVPADNETKRAPVMIRFDTDLLRRVDQAAKSRGVSRSAWVQYTRSRALENGEG